MDGFAVSSAAGPPGGGALLRIQGRALADHGGDVRLLPGTCVEVATGTLLPSGADAVVPVEDTEPGPDPGTVRIRAWPRAGAHVSARGSDYRAGDVLIGEGARVTAPRVAAAAAAGIPRLTVVDRPRVLVVATGDEVVAGDGPLAPGHVRESNSVGLAALIGRRGGAATRHTIVPDETEALAGALAGARAFDAAVFTGGTSAGVKDLLAPTLAREGAVAFHGVALRPGKPILFGSIGHVPVLGLPGNPTSCMLGAHLFLVPILDHLLGAGAVGTTSRPARLGGDVRGFVRASPPSFVTAVLVRLAGPEALPVTKDSMTVTGASMADGYFLVGPGQEPPAPGAQVDVTVFD
jgi:molybdopterin molybdotransferase